jgi:hypothetical protein
MTWRERTEVEKPDRYALYAAVMIVIIVAIVPAWRAYAVELMRLVIGICYLGLLVTWNMVVG